jgi:KaiC/GvpD/RAD55 family RecA-like ATPase
MAEVANSYSTSAITVADDFLFLINSSDANVAITTQGFALNHEFIIDGLIDPTSIKPQNAQRFD